MGSWTVIRWIWPNAYSSSGAVDSRNHKFPSAPVVISVGLPTLDVGIGYSVIVPAPRAARGPCSEYETAAINTTHNDVHRVTGRAFLIDAQVNVIADTETIKPTSE